MKYLILILIYLSTINMFSNDIYLLEKANPNSQNIFDGAIKISCIDEYNCILLRLDNNGSGLILERTSDGGNSWSLIYADTSFKSSDSIYYPQYWGVKCEYFSDGTMIILTSNGKIIRSDDFGESFTEYPKIEKYESQSFIMLDSVKALTTSSAWADMPDSKYQILKSTDGCKSWVDFPVPDSISEKWDLYNLYLQKDKSIFIYCDKKYGIESDPSKNYFYHTDFEASFWNFFRSSKIY
jgi:hypothetical protein